jgi:hypothetical protein
MWNGITGELRFRHPADESEVRSALVDMMRRNSAVVTEAEDGILQVRGPWLTGVWNPLGLVRARVEVCKSDDGSFRVAYWLSTRINLILFTSFACLATVIGCLSAAPPAAVLLVWVCAVIMFVINGYLMNSLFASTLEHCCRQVPIPS